jgi:hypothetical protein
MSFTFTIRFIGIIIIKIVIERIIESIKSSLKQNLIIE